MMKKHLAATASISFIMLVSAFFWLFTAATPSPESKNFVSEETPPSGYLFDTIRTDLRDYIWPTNASTRITSSFAEYRSNHFHAGIDISTNGTTGYEVYAVRDGYISRVRIFANNYGKMLYVTHPDGYVSTYAHLRGFNEIIASRVEEEQNRRGTYPIDLTLNGPFIPVNKGDVIAYTGESGVGPPHLHFEIYDENMNPVNPLLCPSYTPDDNIPPSLDRLMIAPLDFASMVGTGNNPLYLSRFRGKRTSRSVPQPIHIEGRIGLGIQASDLANGSRSRSGVHSIDFYLDDSLMYGMRLDRFPNNDTKQIYLHYDLPSIVDGAGKFQKLYVDHGNILPFYHRRQPGSGIINTDHISPGLHAFRIVCKDIRENISELTGTLLVNPRPLIDIANVNDQALTLMGSHLEPVTKCVVQGKKLYGRKWSVHTIDAARFTLEQGAITLAVNSTPYDILKVTAETKNGIRSAPVFHFKRKPANSPHILTLKHQVMNDFIRIQLTSIGSITSKPVVTVTEGATQQTVTLEAVDIDSYKGAFIPSVSYSGEREIRAVAEVNGTEVYAVNSLELIAIPPDKGGVHFTGANNELRISYDSGAVFKPLFIRLKPSTSGSGLPLYSLEPVDVLLNRGIRFSLPVPQSSTGDRYSLFFRGAGGWIFQTAEPDSGGPMLTTKLTRTLGEIAIMRDNQPPSIAKLKVQARKNHINISFRYADNLSGVDPDEIKLYIDDTPVIPEIDGEHRRAWFSGAGTFVRGRHDVRVSVMDNALNRSTTSKTFTIR